MELEIGKRYNVQGLIYEVVEATGNISQCADCDLMYKEEGVCMDKFGHFGECGRNWRSDNKDVVFKYIDEGDDPAPDGKPYEVK